MRRAELLQLTEAARGRTARTLGAHEPGHELAFLRRAPGQREKSPSKDQADYHDRNIGLLHFLGRLKSSSSPPTGDAGAFVLAGALVPAAGTLVAVVAPDWPPVSMLPRP